MRSIERLREKAALSTRRVVGLMSGTSVDGIDACLVEIRESGGGPEIEILAFESFPYPQKIREAVFRQFRPSESSVEEICHLDFLLGELFAAATVKLLERHGYTSSDVDLIGTAGQTLWHDPSTIRQKVEIDWLDEPVATRSTLAIGQSAVVAERLGAITIGDLRVRDVAAGGEGAPLVAYADWVLLTHPEMGRCVQNIGGIANVTWLPPNGRLEDVLAFDTGPGNMVIDALAEVATGGEKTFDEDGAFAAAGTIRQDLLEDWMRDPYFSRNPPKTTGRERFGVHFTQRIIASAPGVPIDDLIATATALTAQSIAKAYRDFVEPIGKIHQVVLGGGGTRNPVLVGMLRSLLPGIDLLHHEELGIDSRAKEAVAMALIANDSLLGRCTNVPGATGGRPVILGKINL